MAEYIDKDKILKELLDWCTIYGCGGLSTNDIKRIFKENIPAVKKRGEWVRRPNKNIEFVVWDVCTATKTLSSSRGTYVRLAVRVASDVNMTEAGRI